MLNKVKDLFEAVVFGAVCVGAAVLVVTVLMQPAMHKPF